MVNDVLVSCYGIEDHSLAHLALLPMRRLSTVVDWIFCNDIGFPVFITTALDLKTYLLL